MAQGLEMIKLKDLLKEAQTGHIVDHHPAMAFAPMDRTREKKINEMHVDRKINDRGYAELKKEAKHMQTWARLFGKAIKYKDDMDIYQFVMYMEAKVKDFRSVLDNDKNIKKRGEA